MSLYAKQSAARLRQPVRRGRSVRLHEDPIAELQVRVRLAFMWIKGASERELAKHCDRPIGWIRAWLDDRSPLF